MTTTKTYFGWLAESVNSKNGREHTLTTCKRYNGEITSTLRRTSTRTGKGYEVKQLGGTVGTYPHGKIKRATKKAIEKLHETAIEYFMKRDF